MWHQRTYKYRGIWHYEGENVEPVVSRGIQYERAVGTYGNSSNIIINIMVKGKEMIGHHATEAKKRHISTKLAQRGWHASTPKTKSLNVTHSNCSLSLTLSHTHTHADTIVTSPRGAAQSFCTTNLWMLISSKEQKTSRSQTLWNQKMSNVQKRGQQPTRTEPKSRPKAENGTSQLLCPAHTQTRPWPNQKDFSLLAWSHFVHF